MGDKFKLLFFIFLLVSTLSFVSSEFSVSSPQITMPGTSSIGYLQSQGLNAFPQITNDQCQAGQDFIIQISPLGCNPTIVRSDLLEEQNSAILCPLMATKVNPLIDVKAIDSISFSGNYPDGISGIGFHPALSAVKTSRSTLLNSPVLNNIGYAVIVLKQNPNESSMPDKISGQMTATLQYDIKNAFGVGQGSYYLPELSDNDWEKRMNQFSFWNGRGYLKSSGIDNNGATIEIFENKDKRLASVTLQNGESSRDIYLPGFYCMASLQVQLSGVNNPDTRARLEVNGDIVEIPEGSTFLEGQCTVRKIEKAGIIQRTSVTCLDDDGNKNIELAISPKVKVSFTAPDGRNVVGDYNVGDKLYDLANAKKSVYIAYVGENPAKELYMVLAVSTAGGADEFRNTYLYRSLPSQMRTQDNTRAGSLSKFIKGGVSNLVGQLDYVYKGDMAVAIICQASSGSCNSDVDRPTISALAGDQYFDLVSKIKLVGFADPKDSSALGNNPNFVNAVKDLMRIVSNFPKEKQSLSDTETFGEKALFESITLAKDLNQNKKLYELCNDFESRYPNSAYTPSVGNICLDEYKISNEEISSESVTINGFTKRISFDGVYEPTYEDYGAEIEIRKDGGGSEVISLIKDQIYYLPVEKTDVVYSTTSFLAPAPVYFKFVTDHWEMSTDWWSWQGVSNVASSFTAGAVAGGAAGAVVGIGVPGVAIGGTVGGIGNTLFNSWLQKKEAREMITSLANKNFEDGKTILTQKYSAKSVNLPTQFIKLNSIQDEKNVVLDLSLKSIAAAQSTTLFSNPSLSSRVLSKDNPITQDQYTFIVRNINLKKVAKVSIIPNIKRANSQSNFTFSIGIEKRAIQLSPEKAEKRIEQLDKTIDQWNKISEGLEKVVEGFKKTCLGMSAVLTAKNFFSNLGGEALARNQVMSSTNGWMNFCSKQVTAGKYLSVDNCLLENNDLIESDVSTMLNVMDSQTTFTDKSANASIPVLYDKLDSYLRQSSGYTNDPVLKAAISSKGYDAGKISLSQAKDIERNVGLLSDSSISENSQLKAIASSQLNQTLANIRENSKIFQGQLDFATELGGFDSSKIGLIQHTKGIVNYPYYDTTYYDLKKAKPSLIIPGLNDSDSVAIDYSTDGKKMIIPLVAVGAGEFVPKRDEKDSKYILFYDGSGSRVMDYEMSTQLSKIVFKRYDRSAYVNPIEEPKVKYFEDGQYKGMPSIVPFKTKEGWYAAMRQTTPILGQIQTYQDSGAVSSFYLCNVGKNRKIDFESGVNDDICQGFNPGVTSQATSFYGLESADVNQIIRDATTAISQAQKQYSSGVRSVNILDETIPVGEPSANIPEMQCQNFMSPRDCWLLFNACDPVVCPSSRCDFGGAYPVKNVIQSGIIGSIALCLPNAREKIIAPVCLTGVKAGVDSLISVFKNYKDCLKVNVETGQTIGVCDEIHSIYLCEFFWRQAIPLTEVSFPKLIEFVTGQGQRGGGEYMSVQSAFDNANNAVNYMVQYYGASSYNVFKTKLTDEIGSSVCKSYASATYPSGVDLFDTFMGGDSPSQYSGWFSEIPFTTATVPATSQYKVFYHIFAGKDSGVQYQVYLKNPKGGSYYQTFGSPTVMVASGFITVGDYASQTKDFTAEAGYQQLCINVNGEENCDFKQVSTDFAVTYLKDSYVKGQAEDKTITKERECVSGTPGIDALLTTTPNVQELANEGVNPAIYNRGLVRVCATDSPGKGTDSYWTDPKKSRWVEVGYCDNERIKCWIDTKSVENALTFSSLANESVGEIRSSQLDAILNEGIASGQFVDFDSVLESVNSLKTPSEKISKLDDNTIDRVFFGNQKATLLFIRAISYGELARDDYKTLLKTVNAGGFKESEITPGSSNVNIWEQGKCISTSPVATVSPTTKLVNCQDAGEKILKVAASRVGTNEYRTATPGINSIEKVCARFVTHVVVDAGAKGINLPKTVCGWDNNQFLIDNLPSFNFVEIPSSQYAKGFEPGDLIIFDKLYDKTTDHAIIFSNYDASDNKRVYGYGDPGMSSPVNFVSYPIDNREGIYSDRNGWYVYHVFRYNGKDISSSGCDEIIISPTSVVTCESCNSDNSCTKVECDGIASQQSIQCSFKPSYSNGVNIESLNANELAGFQSATECSSCGVGAGACTKILCDALSGKFNVDGGCSFEDKLPNWIPGANGGTCSRASLPSSGKTFKCSNVYDSLINTYSQKFGVPAQVIKGVIAVESAFNPSAAGDGGKALGLMQIWPTIHQATCSSQCGFSSQIVQNEYFDAEKNICCGTAILSQNYKAWTGGNPSAACIKFRSYTGWNAALRGYNGWSNVACSAGNPTYVEDVNSAMISCPITVRN